MTLVLEVGPDAANLIKAFLWLFSMWLIGRYLGYMLALWGLGGKSGS